jgi:hypothetical protein
MPGADRLRHIAGNKWSHKRYLNMDLRNDLEIKRTDRDGRSSIPRRALPKRKSEKFFTLPDNVFTLLALNDIYKASRGRAYGIRTPS